MSPVHSEKQIYDSLQIGMIMIVVTVFLLIMNPTVFRLIHNQNEIATTIIFFLILNVYNKNNFGHNGKETVTAIMFFSIREELQN